MRDDYEVVGHDDATRKVGVYVNKHMFSTVVKFGMVHRRVDAVEEMKYV